MKMNLSVCVALLCTTILANANAEEIINENVNDNLYAIEENDGAEKNPNATAPSKAVGYFCAGISVLFFGSNFVPVKTFETGDGLFFQLILCLAIWTVGNIVNIVRHFPAFHGLAVLGGALWATGNILAVPVIKLIGLSLGLLIWGTTGMLVGWSTGRFGLFGLNKSDNLIQWMNYAGVGMAVLSLSLYAFIKPDEDDDEKEVTRLTVKIAEHDYASLAQPTSRIITRDVLIPTSKVPRVRSKSTPMQVPSEILIKYDQEYAAGYGSLNAANIEAVLAPDQPREEVGVIDTLTPTQKRLMGVAGAALSGILYGTNFTPPQYIIDHEPVKSTDPFHELDFVFSHFTGIMLASFAYFLLYCAVMKNRPHLYPQVVLPAFVSGLMWACAQVGWFVANGALGFATSFPIITSGPGFVSMIWGVFLFREIVGTRNYMILGAAFVCTIISGALISLSQK